VLSRARDGLGRDQLESAGSPRGAALRSGAPAVGAFGAAVRNRHTGDDSVPGASGDVLTGARRSATRGIAIWPGDRPACSPARVSATCGEEAGADRTMPVHHGTISGAGLRWPAPVRVPEESAAGRRVSARSPAVVAGSDSRDAVRGIARELSVAGCCDLVVLSELLTSCEEAAAVLDPAAGRVRKPAVLPSVTPRAGDAFSAGRACASLRPPRPVLGVATRTSVLGARTGRPSTLAPAGRAGAERRGSNRTFGAVSTP